MAIAARPIVTLAGRHLRLEGAVPEHRHQAHPERHVLHRDHCQPRAFALRDEPALRCLVAPDHPRRYCSRRVAEGVDVLDLPVAVLIHGGDGEHRAAVGGLAGAS